jgi:predicted aspartyl protease
MSNGAVGQCSAALIDFPARLSDDGDEFKNQGVIVRFTYVLAIACVLGTILRASAADELHAADPPEVQGSLEGVTVEATEPRYVAPTQRDRIGRIWAPVYINGQGPFRLVLDSGATHSAIVRSVAERLGLPVVADHTVSLRGVTGKADVPYVVADRMEVGDLELTDAKLPVVPDVFGGAEGVLGTQRLLDKRIWIGFRKDLIRIEYARGKPRPEGFVTVKFDIVRGRLVVLDLMVGGVPTEAIIDTGAETTVGNNSLREALVLRNRQATDTDIVGVTLDVAPGKSIGIPPIWLGTIQVRNLHITFGDMPIFEYWHLTQKPTLLIGMDVIGSLDTFVIDYKRRELYLRAKS